MKAVFAHQFLNTIEESAYQFAPLPDLGQCPKCGKNGTWPDDFMQGCCDQSPQEAGPYSFGVAREMATHESD